MFSLKTKKYITSINIMGLLKINHYFYNGEIIAKQCQNARFFLQRGKDIIDHENGNLPI